jgi:hypothetical protein
MAPGRGNYGSSRWTASRSGRQQQGCAAPVGATSFLGTNQIKELGRPPVFKRLTPSQPQSRPGTLAEHYPGHLENARAYIDLIERRGGDPSWSARANEWIERCETILAELETGTVN